MEASTLELRVSSEVSLAVPTTLVLHIAFPPSVRLILENQRYRPNDPPKHLRLFEVGGCSIENVDDRDRILVTADRKCIHRPDPNDLFDHANDRIGNTSFNEFAKPATYAV